MHGRSMTHSDISRELPLVFLLCKTYFLFVLSRPRPGGLLRGSLEHFRQGVYPGRLGIPQRDLRQPQPLISTAYAPIVRPGVVKSTICRLHVTNDVAPLTGSESVYPLFFVKFMAHQKPALILYSNVQMYRLRPYFRRTGVGDAISVAIQIVLLHE